MLKSSVWVYFLMTIWALSTWITVNGVFSQIPIFMKVLPEKYTIATNIVLMVQIANFFPFAFLIISIFVNTKNTYNFDTIAIYFILALGLISIILFGIFWNYTIYIFGREVSLPFYILLFFVASTDCLT